MEKQTENLSETLNLLAEKLGVRVDDLFETVTKQAKIELAMNVVYLILFVAMFISGIYLTSYFTTFWESTERFPPGKQLFILFGTVGTGFLLLIPLVLFLPTIKDIITLKNNPKYWALNDILSSL